MRLSRVLTVSGFLMATVAGGVLAQQGDVELGIDSGVTVSIVSDSDNFTTICLPCQRFRVGFFMSDAVSLEPAITLNVLSGGGETLTHFTGGASLLYHFRSDPHRTRVFLRGGAQFTLVDVGGASVNQFAAGGGFGVKVPAGGGAVRLEGIGLYNFENDDFQSSFDLGALIGFSFFLH